jgi:hypothetical protein
MSLSTWDIVLILLVGLGGAYYLLKDSFGSKPATNLNLQLNNAPKGDSALAEAGRDPVAALTKTVSGRW